MGARAMSRQARAVSNQRRSGQANGTIDAQNRALATGRNSASGRPTAIGATSSGNTSEQNTAATGAETQGRSEKIAKPPAVQQQSATTASKEPLQLMYLMLPTFPIDGADAAAGEEDVAFEVEEADEEADAAIMKMMYFMKQRKPMKMAQLLFVADVSEQFAKLMLMELMHCTKLTNLTKLHHDVVGVILIRCRRRLRGEVVALGDGCAMMGFYAGYIASAFTFGRFVGGYATGHMTDHVGRKPVIVGGLASIMVCSLAFGLAPTYNFAIASRLILGLTNGMASATKTTMREVCGQEHVMQGMSYICASKSVSIMLGTGIGGLLAQPAVNFPGIFSAAGVFGRHPFLLPNLVGSLGALLLLLTVMVHIPETKHFGGQCGGGGGGGDGGGYRAIKGDRKFGLFGPNGLFATPQVKTVLFLVCVVQALIIGFEEAFPLWALSTPDVGGLGWGTIEIGKVFIGAGMAVAALQLVIFPPLIKALGITAWQRIGGLLAIPAFVAVPCTTRFSSNDNSLLFMSTASTSLVYCSTAMVNLSLTIASTTMVHSEMLGKLAGLYNMSESLGRFMGPAGFATVFAWSISTSSPHWVDCRFVFWAAAAAMALVAFVAWGTLTQEKVMPQPSTSSPPPPHSINQACVRGVPVVSCGGSKQEMV
eukprot:jgi/Undpi1/8471/HiC_scaffold_25.g10938.m1